MRKAYLLITAIFLFWWCFCLSSCNVLTSPTDTVSFILPQWPPENQNDISYPPLEKWFIKVEGQNISQEYYSTSTKIEMNLPKNIPCAVTATPITCNMDFFYPAGAIYPYFLNNDYCEDVTWEKGYTASLMQSIYKSRIDTGLSIEHIQKFQQSFNWKKCQQSIETKIKESEDSFYNPWKINKQSLLENLCYASFSASYFTTEKNNLFNLEDLGLSQVESILSRYIPENRYIKDYKMISLQKDKTELLMCNQLYAAQITYSTSKKVSVAYVYLPILY